MAEKEGTWIGKIAENLNWRVAFKQEGGLSRSSVLIQVNLLNVGPTFFTFSSIYSEGVVSTALKNIIICYVAVILPIENTVSMQLKFRFNVPLKFLRRQLSQQYVEVCLLFHHVFGHPHLC